MELQEFIEGVISGCPQADYLTFTVCLRPEEGRLLVDTSSDTKVSFTLLRPPEGTGYPRVSVQDDL